MNQVEHHQFMRAYGISKIIFKGLKKGLEGPRASQDFKDPKPFLSVDSKINGCTP